MSTTFPYSNYRPYETPWPWKETPHEGSTVMVGSNATATVIKITERLIYLDNGRAFTR